MFSSILLVAVQQNNLGDLHRISIDLFSTLSIKQLAIASVLPATRLFRLGSRQSFDAKFALLCQLLLSSSKS